MKKIISILLLLALAVMLLASCDMLNGDDEKDGDGEKNSASVGYLTDGTKGYFVTPDGVVEISGGAAKAVASAPEGTPESKKFDAPDTFAATFTTEAFGSGVAITGVSGADVVMVPKTIDGKAVLGIKAGAFDGVKAVIIGNPDAAITVNDDAFRGVGNVYIATAADNLLVGKTLLANSASTKISISADEYSNYKVHYNWAEHKDNLKKY